MYRFSPFFSHVQIDFPPDDDKFDDLCTFKKRYALSKKGNFTPPKNLHFYLIQASCLVMKNMYSVMSLASLTRNFLSLMTCIDEQVFWNKNTLFLTELKFVEFFRADISKKS